MSRKLLMAVIAAAWTIAACATPPAPTTTSRLSAELGTVPPAYPVGELEPGIEVLEAIPVTDLSVTDPVPFAGTDLCDSVPANVVDGATPVTSDQRGCIWDAPKGMTVEIGAWEGAIAKEVEEHLAMANGGTADNLAHLTWLRIDDHHSIERILETGPSKGLLPDTRCVGPPRSTCWCTGPTPTSTRKPRYENCARPRARSPRTSSPHRRPETRLVGTQHSPDRVK